MKIQIPRTALSRREATYALLLWRVHPNRTAVNAFEGVYLKPGSTVEYPELWPTPAYPEKPVLLEFAGSDHTGKGHNRSNQIYVLWRFEPGKQEWVEVIRCKSIGTEWFGNLLPVAIRQLGGPPDPDHEVAARVSDRVLSQLDGELFELLPHDRNIALSLLYEQVAARLVIGIENFQLFS